MGHKIHTSYNWYKTDTDRFIIKTYYIDGIAFTFEEPTKDIQEHSEIIKEADGNPTYTPEFFFLKSRYLLEEECHPLLFELDLENPEILDELDSPY